MLLCCFDIPLNMMLSHVRVRDALIVKEGATIPWIIEVARLRKVNRATDDYFLQIVRVERLVVIKMAVTERHGVSKSHNVVSQLVCRLGLAMVSAARYRA